jgi:hypothetical protein
MSQICQIPTLFGPGQRLFPVRAALSFAHGENGFDSRSRHWAIGRAAGQSPRRPARITRGSMMAKLKRKPRKPRKPAAKKPFDWRTFKPTDYVAKEEPSDHGRHRRP